jgi:hypothetical protein
MSAGKVSSIGRRSDSRSRRRRMPGSAGNGDRVIAKRQPSVGQGDSIVERLRDPLRGQSGYWAFTSTAFLWSLSIS